MDPVTLIVGALAAGALSGAGETASTAVKDAYAGLKTAVTGWFAGEPTAELVLAEHEQDPETYAQPLAKHLQDTGAVRDPRVVELAHELMTLLDAAAVGQGKHTVDVRDSKGVQIGDHNTQTNTFN